MRCASCHSYIPEGLSSPATCPQCGGRADAPSAEPSFAPRQAESPASETPASSGPKGFAPYFTIKARVSFGLATQKQSPSFGSLSFGDQGFSVVWDEGKRWEKIPYRELSQLRLVGESVILTVRDVESKLTIHHPWMPGGRKKRALIFLELVERVKNGLSPFEIKMYQRRLG